MKKCEATNEAGAPCLFLEHSTTVRHLWADDEDRNSFDLGRLQAAVSGFLAGHVDRNRLAATLTETEAGR